MNAAPRGRSGLCPDPKNYAVVALVVALSLVTSAAAQDAPLGKLDSDVQDLIGEDARLIVGGGLGAITQPYVGADSVRYVPEPLIIYHRERMEFIGRTTP